MPPHFLGFMISSFVFMVQFYLINNKLSLEDGHEVAWLLPHADPNLHQGSIKLPIQLYCLVC